MLRAFSGIQLIPYRKDLYTITTAVIVARHTKEDPNCWLILFTQVYRICLASVLENKNLFQILGLTGS